MRCPACKTNWASGVTHCDLCNIDMEEYEPPPKPRKGKKNSGSIVNRILGGVGILIGGGMLAAQLMGEGMAAANMDTATIIGLIFSGLFVLAGLYYAIVG